MNSLLWPYSLCPTCFSSVFFGLPQAPPTLLPMARNSENAALPKFHTDAELLEIAPQTNLTTTTVRSGVDRKQFENRTFRERSNDLKDMILLPEFLQSTRRTELR